MKSGEISLDNLKFNLRGGNYRELADAFEFWAEQFLNGTADDITEEDHAWHVQDAYGDCIAYLMYNISKEMRCIARAEMEE